MATDISFAAVARSALSLRWSITGRLVRHYFFSTSLLLLASTVYLYYGLHRSLAEQGHALLASKVKVLRVLLGGHEENPAVLRSEIEHEAGEESVLKYFLRVLDGDGRVLVETPGMSQALPPAVFPPPGLRGDPMEPAERTLTSGHEYLLGAALAGVGDDPASRRVLHVALDVSPNEDVLAGYRNNLLAAFIGGSLVAALIGALVARAGLRPLARITHATQQTTASRLNARISQTLWPTELTELARSFDGMLDRLEGSFRRLDQCTGDMAHALRNPINNLRGEAEVVLQRARTPQEYQQTLASSLEEYDRLARMIDGLLFIARADEAHTALEVRPFDVRAEIEAVREFYDALATEKGVQVTSAGEARLEADSMLVRRAISNLLANALKHTPAGGAITIAARSFVDGAVEITVTDTGGGIPAEHVDRVFERFFQVDKTRDQTVKGAGLGLAIVRSIMHLHGGTAELASTPRQGTRVKLRFPPRPTSSIHTANR
ncbi:MAG: two-component sensor histidine kinase [Opitutus sp.]|nr:two-component sensor histidine kinase [Opitutus sp.]